MGIPWDLIHSLESKFKSVSKVPDDNPDLIKVQQILNPQERAGDFEDRAIELLNEGYGSSEIVEIFGVPKHYVVKVIRKKKAKPLPQFRYCAVKKGKPRIFCNSFNGYKVIVQKGCYSYEIACKKLKKRGYELHKMREPVIWSRLMPGDNYINNNEVCVKE